MDLLSTEDKYHMTQLLGGRAGILTQACSNLAATSLKKKSVLPTYNFCTCVCVCACLYVEVPAHVCVRACAHMEARG